MEYKIITLEEKTVVGVSARTNNFAPDIGEKIGGLWSKFYQSGIYSSIENKKNEKALGIYTEYAGDEKEDYTIVVACEVEKADVIPDTAIKTKIPAGKYAKFEIIGDVKKDVSEFWSQLWKMDLPRSFVCDFEEYENDNMENSKVNIYIGLK